MRRFAERSLPDYQRPHRLRKLPALPRLSTGKSAYAELCLRQAPPAPIEAPTEAQAGAPEKAHAGAQGVPERIAAVFAAHAGADDWTRQDSYFEIGGDSLTYLRFQLEIEAAAGRCVDWDAFLLSGASYDGLTAQLAPPPDPAAGKAELPSVFAMPMHTGALSNLAEIVGGLSDAARLEGLSAPAPTSARGRRRHHARRDADAVGRGFAASGGRVLFGYSAGGTAAIELAARMRRDDLDLILIEPYLFPRARVSAWRSCALFARALLSPALPDIRIGPALKDRTPAAEYLWRPRRFRCRRALLVHGPEYPETHRALVHRMAQGEVSSRFIDAPHVRLMRGEAATTLAEEIRGFLQPSPSGQDGAAGGVG